ncbi:hypothetical protein NE237_024378 [Protea cynaroides]|uniref:TLC domain-containing protein n=1 Tax=Protea cynaroides TaxID=273540 RepID=A0A9Q0HEJ4_9MAGN|nr:hypothetical protein NE237_024378 [Protea cynaroides]
METLRSSVSTLPMFLLIFLVIYRSPHNQLEASSCLISLAQGTLACLLADFAILQIEQSQRGFASPNTIFQNTVLEFSIAYFLMDLLHYLIFFPSDILFIAHHLVTLFMFLTCKYMVFHGAFTLLVLLFLAEITSGCQNIWTLANACRVDVPTTTKLYELSSPPFYVIYYVVRGLMGPVFIYRMGIFYKSDPADNMIQRWLTVPGWLYLAFLVG